MKDPGTGTGVSPESLIFRILKAFSNVTWSGAMELQSRTWFVLINQVVIKYLNLIIQSIINCQSIIQSNNDKLAPTMNKIVAEIHIKR